MRMWEIREGYSPRESHSKMDGRPGYETGFRSPEAEKAYKMGYEDGYGKAMRDAKEREYGSRAEVGMRGGSYGMRGDYGAAYDPEAPELGERRRNW